MPTEPDQMLRQLAGVSTRPGGSFDSKRPPSSEVIADCVHCGFCLPACPTFALWGNEADSPRGRIYLMKLATRGEIPLDEEFSRHIDSCLGCMGCVTACPSGVRYDELLAAVRPQVERHVSRKPLDRALRSAIFALFPYPKRLRLAAIGAFAYQRSGLRRVLAPWVGRSRLGNSLSALDELMPEVEPAQLLRPKLRYMPARGSLRSHVALVTGCVQSVFFPGVNQATARVLAAEGCAVGVPRQGCCGALSAHAGREAEAQAFARAMIDAIGEDRFDHIVVNAAGCGSAMKEYGHLLSDDPEYADRAANFASKVVDVSELLTGLEPRAVRHPISVRLAYQDACHLAHAQKVRDQPRQLLRSIPGVELVEIPDAGLCCGSAGIYNLVQPEAGVDLGRRKAAAVRSVAPDALVSANPGCLLQLGRHLDHSIPLRHYIEVVDASIRATNPF